MGDICLILFKNPGGRETDVVVQERTAAISCRDCGVYNDNMSQIEKYGMNIEVRDKEKMNNEETYHMLWRFQYTRLLRYE